MSWWLWIYILIHILIGLFTSAFVNYNDGKKLGFLDFISMLISAILGPVYLLAATLVFYKASGPIKFGFKFW